MRQVQIRRFRRKSQESMQAEEVLKSACIMFATIPIVIVYPFIQKYFVKGVMIGAVKE